MSDISVISPQRPYLLEALFQWICDNNLTPYIVVQTNFPQVEVPPEFVKDNQIVLNIAPRAVADFFLDKNSLSFTARFGGVPRQIFVPIGAIAAIFARENNAGMSFPPEPFYQEQAARGQIQPVPTEAKAKGRKAFKVIDNADAETEVTENSSSKTESATEATSDANIDSATDSTTPTKKPAKSTKRKPATESEQEELTKVKRASAPRKKKTEDATVTEPEPNNEPPTGNKPKKGRPALRVIK